MRPSSRSAIVDGISVALGEMKKARNKRRILWVISNGGSDASPGAQDEIARQISESGVEVFPVRSHEQIAPGYLTITPLDSIGLRFLPLPTDTVLPHAYEFFIMPVSRLPEEAARYFASPRRGSSTGSNTHRRTKQRDGAPRKWK